MSPEAIGGAAFLVVGILFLISKILAAIGSWKVFTKSGEAGWKAFIPFYNKYVRFNLYWDKKFFWLYLIAYVVATTLGANATGLMGLVVAAIAIAGAVVTIKMEMKCQEVARAHVWGKMMTGSE